MLNHLNDKKVIEKILDVKDSLGESLLILTHHYQRKEIVDLHYSLCPNMFKINLENLLKTLENIGQVNVITVPEAIKKDARLTLERMLTLGPKKA